MSIARNLASMGKYITSSTPGSITIDWASVLSQQLTEYATSNDLPTIEATGALAYIADIDKLYFWDTNSWRLLVNREAGTSELLNVFSPVPTDPYDSVADFGNSIAISPNGNYAVIGIPEIVDPNTLLAGVGAAFIINPQTNTVLHKLYRNRNSNTNINFGYSVAISNTYCIVSAPEILSGAGQVFIYNNETGALLWTITNPNAYSTSSLDRFGWSVAVSDTYAIVGAYTEDDDGGLTSGKAYVFNIATGALLYTLDNPNAYNTSLNDSFGWSVAISDNYAIVGAYLEDDVGGASSGKAYVFNIATGALLYTLDNPNAYSTSANDWFGYSVAISDNYAIVGTFSEDDAGSLNSGKAYVFNPSTGALLYTLDNPNAYSTPTSDYFGYSVAISDNYIIVGAYQEDDTGGTSSGKAYVFNPATGALLYTLDNPNAYSTSASDNFGSSVAISDSYILVSAAQEASASSDANSFGIDGNVYIFNTLTGAHTNTVLNNSYNIFSIGGHEFGTSVAISDSYIIVGSPSSLNDTGYVCIYAKNTGALLHTISNSNAYGSGNGDRFGYSVAITDNYAIVGAYGEDDVNGSESGKAYIFNPSTGQLLWTLNNPNAYSTSLNDWFGYSVAISNNYAIVGAYGEDDVNGSESGKAYIFNPSTGTLLWILDNPNAYSTSNVDRFGWSVAISNNYAIVGAYLEDDAGGTSSGKAYVFNPATGALLWTLDNPNAYNTSLSDYFGYSVAVSNNYAIVGAYGEDDTAGASSGKAYVFNPATGQLLWTLNNPNAYSTGTNDDFGISVAISDNYAIVGAWGEDDASGTSSGKAYIFDPATGQLLWTLNNPNAYSTSASDQFGLSVAINGTTVVVGVPLEDATDGVSNSGKVYVFKL